MPFSVSLKAILVKLQAPLKTAMGNTGMVTLTLKVTCWLPKNRYKNSYSTCYRATGNNYSTLENV